MIPKDKWVWYGYPGHFVCANRCVYHLNTRIGNRLVSTVGHYIQSGDMEMGVMSPLGAEPYSYFETFVFECHGEDDYGNPIVDSWQELERKRYATSREAELGHRAICDQVAAEQ